MNESFNKSIDALFWFAGASVFIFLPLGTWKLIELVVLLVKHVTVSVR